MNDFSFFIASNIEFNNILKKSPALPSKDIYLKIFDDFIIKISEVFPNLNTTFKSIDTQNMFGKTFVLTAKIPETISKIDIHSELDNTSVCYNVFSNIHNFKINNFINSSYIFYYIPRYQDRTNISDEIIKMKIGNKRALKILNDIRDKQISFSNDNELYDYIKNFFKKSFLKNDHEKQEWLSKVDDIISNSLKNNIHMVNYFEIDYPSCLIEIENPPLILHYKGNYQSIIQKNSIAIIGTRSPLDFSFKSAQKISFELSLNQINIISGLALGCDTAAHLGALDAQEITTAILAHGLDTIYHKETF